MKSRAVARAIAALAHLRSVNARGLGRLSLEVERLDSAPWRAEAAAPPPESAFSLVREDGSWACLTLERFFALSLVRAALGAPAPPVVRPLSPAERGVLGATVATVLSASGSGRVRLSLERARPPAADYVTLHLTVRDRQPDRRRAAGAPGVLVASHGQHAVGRGRVPAGDLDGGRGGPDLAAGGRLGHRRGWRRRGF